MFRIVLLACVLILSFSFAEGQTIDEESNWFKETGRDDNWYTHFDFKRYSKDDVLRAKSKYLRIVGRQDLDEWEGSYTKEVMLGQAELTWSYTDGFAKAYTYHTLAQLDYGSVVSGNDSLTFRTEKPQRNSQPPLRNELIKVLFGSSHFLVPLEKLRDFASLAAGLVKSQDENDFFWIKTADEKAKVFGLPIFPKRFAHLVRQQLLTRVVSYGKPILHEDKFDNGEVYAEYYRRTVTLDAGMDKGVKVDMDFFLDDLNEWIQIVRVSKTRSFGVLSRSLSKSRQEVCWEDDSRRGRELPCLPLKIGINARTLSQEFNF